MAHDTFLVAVHGFLVKNNQVLLLQRHQTGYRDGWWSVPAGHVDAEETVTQAMKREAQEEIGVAINIEKPQLIMNRYHCPEDRIDFFFVIESWQGNITNCETHKCSQLKWVAANKIPSKTIPYIQEAWKQIQKGSYYREYQEK